MSPERPPWWGWGDPPPFPEALAGVGGRPTPPVPIDQVRLPDSRLPDRVRALARTDREERVLHTAGKNYPDLVRLRSGDASGAPDGVLYPESHEEVARMLEICAEEGVAVVPFGGGTSVVGGVEPLRGRFDSVVALDLARIDHLTTDRTSLLGTFGAGLRGPRAEARLAARGLTLGHFPQSFEFATIGGYAATRSAGQASTGYGRFDKLVLGLRMAAPAGEIVVQPFPATAAGPSLRELIVGSEGVLGVITEVTLSLRSLPGERRYEGWSFRGFDEGLEAFRGLAQTHAAPDVARLSDEEETRLAMALSASGSLVERLGKGYLRARGHDGGCIVIAGYEGEPGEVARRAADGARTLRAAGGLSLGRRPGESWLRSRYHGPYLRDALLGRGVMVETLETATTWTRLRELHAGVTDALRGAMAARGTPALVGCHVSHVYPAGASLYFTWMGRAEEGAELEQWRASKSAAMDAIVAHGGTITHHHAVGRDHAPWMAAEVGELGVQTLRAVKERLDPAGIMNPGKLLPEA
ncbi:MAG: alkyldihydroxyacetonephosphate synthase [Thermoleophilaceae bacterium]|jgi:alkyldihydroxyacetonephosphate synthase|nr:alkyldihydroxyacetonephosphate synthase [Thermoleophilaceae bacterium]